MPVTDWLKGYLPVAGWILGGMLLLFCIFRLLVYWVRRRHEEADLRRVTRESGTHGEAMTLRKLRRIGGYKHLLHNLYLPNGRQDGTVEVDAVLVSCDGIFVVETKNYSGTIYGEENDRYWWHELGHGRGGFQFYNPVKQNAGHVRAVRRVLEAGKELPVYSILVFGEAARFDRVQLPTARVSLTRISGLPRTVRRLARRSPGVFSRADVDAIAGRLRAYSHADSRTRKEHLRAIERKKRS